MPRIGFRKIATTAALAVAAGSLSTIAMAPAAQAESASLNYTCGVPILGDQTFSVVADTDAPDSIAVGETFTPTVTSTVTIPSNVSGAIKGLLGAETAEGSAVAQTLVNGESSSVDLTVPVTTIPDGELTVVATGEGAPVTATEAGEIVLATGDFSSHLLFKKADGSEALTADVDCALDEGQDATVDTVAVVSEECAAAQATASDTAAALAKAKTAVTKATKATKSAKSKLAKAKKALKKAKKSHNAKKIKAAKKKVKALTKKNKAAKKKLAAAKAAQKKAAAANTAAVEAVEAACATD
ncbi:hypothetical protein ASG90_11905 [Nocardioides sp. Soil797]|nr:hypothetical protein ASG90_11905 [Nocardioides sp. Soil797]